MSSYTYRENVTGFRIKPIKITAILPEFSFNSGWSVLSSTEQTTDLLQNTLLHFSEDYFSNKLSGSAAWIIYFQFGNWMKSKVKKEKPFRLNWIWMDLTFISLSQQSQTSKKPTPFHLTFPMKKWKQGIKMTQTHQGWFFFLQPRTSREEAPGWGHRLTFTQGDFSSSLTSPPSAS